MTPQHKKITLFAVIITALVAIIWYFVRRKTDTTTTQNTDNEATAGASGSLINLLDSLPEGKFPLKKGTTSKEVFFMQAYFNKEKGEKLTLDGNWGSKTQAAFIKYFTGAELNEMAYLNAFSSQIASLRNYISNL